MKFSKNLTGFVNESLSNKFVLYALMGETVKLNGSKLMPHNLYYDKTHAMFIAISVDRNDRTSTEHKQLQQVLINLPAQDFSNVTELADDTNKQGGFLSKFRRKIVKFGAGKNHTLDVDLRIVAKQLIDGINNSNIEDDEVPIVFITEYASKPGALYSFDMDDIHGVVAGYGSSKQLADLVNVMNFKQLL